MTLFHSILIALSVGSGSAKSLLSKGLGSVNGETNGLAKSNVFIFTAAFLVILFYSFVSGVDVPSLFTVVTGILFAISIATGQILYMKALRLGAVSITAFIYSSGFLLPATAGVIFWHEDVSVAKIIGIALLLLALFLIAWNPGDTISAGNGDHRRSGLVWKLCAFGAMAASGVLGLLQKVHQTSPHKDELIGFLLIAMFFASALSYVLFLFSKKTGDAPYGGKMAGLALSCGAFYGAVNIINLALAGMLPAPVLFPVLNGSTIILTAVLGKLIFHDKVSALKWLGIVIGLIAIVVISGGFGLTDNPK